MFGRATIRLGIGPHSSWLSVILCCFQGIMRYWSKLAKFSHAVYLAPTFEEMQLVFTKMIGSTVSIERQPVTHAGQRNSQTDGQTSIRAIAYKSCT